MKASIFSLLILFSLMVPTLAIGVEENTMEKHHALNQKQQGIIPIAAFTAEGDINRLKPALNQGLDAGLTVNEIKKESNMKIRLTSGDRLLTATMFDNETSRDFISLLPLTLTLKDYAGTEKVSDLPRRLSTQDAPLGSDPSVGDITYYSPWGNLAIFYKDFGYADGLIVLGKFDSGIEMLAGITGGLTVTIEIVE